MAAIDAERKRRGASQPNVSEDLLVAEWHRLTGNLPLAHPDLTAHATSMSADVEAYCERVVLVERLREVRALLGFTRIESPFDGESIAQYVALGTAPPEFLPAVEVRGEGVFLRIREPAVADWCGKPKVVAREAMLRHAHSAWRTARNAPDPHAAFPGMRYVLLHSLSHAIMRRLALNAGYAQAAIRERIYSREPQDEHGPMAGILLSTSASDSEGTLGGLVALGERDALDEVISGALRDVALCASDPFCAEHVPASNAVHGAACHACLFAPETSCERGNRYLDRAVLAKLVGGADISFNGA